MILDRIENAGRYFQGGRIEQALRLLQDYTLQDFVGNRRTIDGENLYFNHSTYKTEPTGNGLLEAHRKYADIMLILEGCEAIYHKSVHQLQNVTMEYNAADDTMLAQLDEDPSKLILKPGYFVIFYPEDAHCPCCDAFQSETVKKVIAKVLL